MRASAKLAAALFVVAASGLLIVWNTSAASAPPALGVSDAKRQYAVHQDREVSVRGTVVEGSLRELTPTEHHFVIADAFEQLRVVYRGILPDSFGVKEVVARGTLVEGDGAVVQLDATAIQVGCSSKY